MNTFKLIAILLCTFLLIPLEGYSQTIEIYTDLKGNEHAAINSEGMVRYKVEERSKSSTFRSYIQLYQYTPDGQHTVAEKDESGHDIYVYRTTRHTERQKEGGCDWKVSRYFIVSPDIFIKNWRGPVLKPVLNHSLFPQKTLLIIGLRQKKEEIPMMHGLCKSFLMIK